MADKLDVESALMNVKGHMAMLDIVHESCLSHAGTDWAELGIKPQEGRVVATFTDTEWYAISFVMTQLSVAVLDLDRQFYAMIRAEVP